MLLDFYLLSAAFFHHELRPILAESWRRRSFTPCESICTQLLAQRPSVPEDCVTRQVGHGLPFAREFWHALAGELLLLGCVELPLLQTAPATLCCLLAPERYRAGTLLRSAFAPIEQVHFGSCDLRFGGAFYRPEHAGYNDTADVARLLAYLEAIDPAAWTADRLAPLPEFVTPTERADELAYVRDWWPPLVDLYREAARRDCIVVCETT